MLQKGRQDEDIRALPESVHCLKQTVIPHTEFKYLTPTTPFLFTSSKL